MSSVIVVVKQNKTISESYCATLIRKTPRAQSVPGPPAKSAEEVNFKQDTPFQEVGLQGCSNP